MFESLTGKFAAAFTALRGRGRIGADEIEQSCNEIHTALLEADVGLSVVDYFVGKIRQRSLDALPTLKASTNPSQAIFQIINEELIAILGGSARRVRYAKKPPTIIILAGLQGSGKTTLAGKLARYLKAQGDTPLLVAADLQRPNAVTQLRVIAEQVKVAIYAPEEGNGIGDPVKVASEAITFARAKLHNIVIIDTAGRLGIDAELMAEASAIRSAVSPDEVLFVMDSMIGQDAVRTAQAFNDGVGFDGVVLTKLDGDARGGAALTITQVTGKPILFASTGEKLTDFEIFHPDRMASRILGMGDIASLAEEAKAAFDGDTAKKLEEKLASGEDFTLDDFLSQLQAMKSMGSISKLMGLLPGLSGAQGAAMKKQIANFDDGELIRTEAIVQSMTAKERSEPKILNGSRRARIANGSGRTVHDVNSLVDRFTAAQKMMRQMRQSGSGGQMPGLNGMVGAQPTKKVEPPKKKSRSGNPAKRG